MRPTNRKAGHSKPHSYNHRDSFTDDYRSSSGFSNTHARSYSSDFRHSNAHARADCRALWWSKPDLLLRRTMRF
jgi:hypothetical protein